LAATTKPSAHINHGHDPLAEKTAVDAPTRASNLWKAQQELLD
jgi:hypothetical protein